MSNTPIFRPPMTRLMCEGKVLLNHSSTLYRCRECGDIYCQDCANKMTFRFGHFKPSEEFYCPTCCPTPLKVIEAKT